MLLAVLVVLVAVMFSPYTQSMQERAEVLGRFFDTVAVAGSGSDLLPKDGRSPVFLQTKSVDLEEPSADPLFGLYFNELGFGNKPYARVFGLYRQVQKCNSRTSYTAPSNKERNRNYVDRMMKRSRAAGGANNEGSGHLSRSQRRAQWVNYQTPLGITGARKGGNAMEEVEAPVVFSVGTSTVHVSPLVLDGEFMLDGQTASFMPLNQTYDHPLVSFTEEMKQSFLSSPAATEASPNFCFTGISLPHHRRHQTKSKKHHLACVVAQTGGSTGHRS